MYYKLYKVKNNNSMIKKKIRQFNGDNDIPNIQIS